MCLRADPDQIRRYLLRIGDHCRCGIPSHRHRVQNDCRPRVQLGNELVEQRRQRFTVLGIPRLPVGCGMLEARPHMHQRQMTTVIEQSQRQSSGVDTGGAEVHSNHRASRGCGKVPAYRQHRYRRLAHR